MEQKDKSLIPNTVEPLLTERFEYDGRPAFQVYCVDREGLEYEGRSFAVITQTVYVSNIIVPVVDFETPLN